MLHGLLLNRALIVAATAACILPLSPTVSAAWADTAQVTVVSPGGAEQTLSLDALAGSQDVSSRVYALRSGEGESTQTVSGFSLAAIVEAAGADPFAFSYLEVQRPGGGSVLLSRHQALDPGAFPDGPPVVYATAAGTGFLRPSSGPDDLNAADSFEAPQGIAIVLNKGVPLQVRARASTRRTRPGRAVEFSAAVEGGGAGEKLIYSWYFDDGDSASGPNARHAFAERGSYDVVVGVTTAGDSTGSSDVVRVQVGAPIGGPDRKGGGRNEDDDAPDHGAAGGSAGTSGGGSPSTGASPSGSGSPAAESSAPATPPVAGQAAPAPRPDREPRQSAPVEPAGEPVSGLLLTGARTPLPPPEADKATAARTGRLSGDRGGGLSLPGATLGLLVTAGLLGLGAFAELRGGLAPPFGDKPPRGAIP